MLLGSTGSIGTQAADVIRRNPGRFRITGIAAGGSDPRLLASQAVEFGAKVVAVAREPAAGQVRVLGQDMLRHRYRVLPRMNFSSPFVDLPHRLTVRQNLLIYARLYGLSRRRERIERLAEDLQIVAFLERPAGKLSAGQKTRVALAKALLNEPELLLLDEPTASLDPDTGDWVRGYLEGYRERTGATILMASHNMAEVERLCSEVMMMKAGRIVDRGSPEALIGRYGRTNLEEVFLHIARGSPTELEPVA